MTTAPVKWFYRGIALLTLLAACSSKPDVVTYDIAFQEGAALDRYVSLIFYDVVEDSRCPVDVECIHAGRVTVALTPLFYDVLSVPIQLTLDPDTPALAHTVVSDEYHVQLLSVAPAPVSNRNLDPDSYTIQIAVAQK